MINGLQVAGIFVGTVALSFAVFGLVDLYAHRAGGGDKTPPPPDAY